MIVDAAPRLPDPPYSASRREAVSVDPFKERFAACLTQRRVPSADGRGWRDLTPEELAAQLADFCGWTVHRADGTVRPDSSRVLRVVGLRTDRGRYRRHIAHDTAAVLCRAMGLDPFEVGI